MWEPLMELHPDWFVVTKTDKELVLKRTEQSIEALSVHFLQNETERCTQQVTEVESMEMYRIYRSKNDSIRLGFKLNGTLFFFKATLDSIQTKNKLAYDLKWKGARPNILSSMATIHYWTTLSQEEKDTLATLYHLFRSIVEERLEQSSKYRLHMVTNNILIDEKNVTLYL